MCCWFLQGNPSTSARDYLAGKRLSEDYRDRASRYIQHIPEHLLRGQSSRREKPVCRIPDRAAAYRASCEAARSGRVYHRPQRFSCKMVLMCPVIVLDVIDWSLRQWITGLVGSIRL